MSKPTPVSGSEGLERIVETEFDVNQTKLKILDSSLRELKKVLNNSDLDSSSRVRINNKIAELVIKKAEITLTL